MSKKTRFLRQMKRAVAEDIKWPHSKTRRTGRVVSSKTRSDRAKFINRFVERIYAAGFKPEKPKNLQSKHLAALFAGWEEQNICRKTLQTYLSNLRMVLRSLDRKDLLQYTDRYYLENSDKYSVTEQGNRTWSSQSVDIQAVMDKLFNMDSLVMLQLTLQHQFGLRVRESFRLRPDECIEPDKLKIIRGAKGGRKRVIPVQHDEERRLLKHVRSVARQLGGSLMPSQYTEKSWRGYYYHVLRSCGVTKRGLGVTSHGLRHEFAQQLYRETSELTPPVDSGTTYRDGDMAEADIKGRSMVAEILGHGRYDITRHYLDQIDNTGTLRKTSTRRPRGHGLRQLARNSWQTGHAAESGSELRA